MQQLMTGDKEVQRLRREIRATRRELDVYRASLERELELAAKVHRSLLPDPIRDPRINVDVRYIPIEQVGGDYCQVRFADPETFFINICDVTGHGIGPALLATRVSSEVRYGILYGRSPREIVRCLNRFIYDHFDETDLYLSFVVARIDLWRRSITWCGAGHPSPLLIRGDGTSVEQLESRNPLIGIFKDVLDDEPEGTLELHCGDRLIFYTDGIFEVNDAEGRQLGTSGLARIAAESKSLDLFESADHILDRVAQFNHGPITDDRTLIVAEIP